MFACNGSSLQESPWFDGVYPPSTGLSVAGFITLSSICCPPTMSRWSRESRQSVSRFVSRFVSPNDDDRNALNLLDLLTKPKNNVLVGVKE
jgi:hypothetical protein